MDHPFQDTSSTAQESCCRVLQKASHESCHDSESFVLLALKSLAAAHACIFATSPQKSRKSPVVTITRCSSPLHAER